MRAVVVTIAIVLQAPASPVLAAANACSLLMGAEVAAILGQPVQGTPTGPERDEDSGGQLTYCFYRAPNPSMFVSIVEFDSPAEARKQLTKHLVEQRMDEEKVTVTEESGIGDKAFFGLSSRGAMYVFQKQGRIIGIGIGGESLANPGAWKERLRSAALAAAGKT